MHEDEPIVLPGLAADRSGPTAAVCTSGHVLSWIVDPSIQIPHCGKCGDPILRSCPACRAPMPPDPEMLQWVPYHSYCQACGKPYPWIDSEITRAKRALAEHAEVEHWSDDTKARADKLVDDIAAGRATGSEIVAALGWLRQRGAEKAEPPILDAIERLAGPELKTALRPSFPGQF
ncbi:MAG: DUF2321 domain-containing protein [Polyangiaceae bacterium]